MSEDSYMKIIFMENIMGDLKSKLPDLNELGAIANKLFKDVKSSISEIITDYKNKHAESEPEKKAEPKKTDKDEK